MSFQFHNYSADELRTCGNVFCEEFCCPRAGATKLTTIAVKQFFARVAATGVTVLGCNGWGELMLDLCHITYPEWNTGHRRIEFWDRILAQPIRMRLALESEWGKYANLNESLVLVLDDAQKLALVRADVKVIVFATRDVDDRHHFLRRINAVRAMTNDSAPWLWIDLPWHVSMSLPPAYGVVAHGSEVCDKA